MMTSRLRKIFAILAVTSLIAACKLAVIVPSGGDVTSASGTRNCAGGSQCEFNITDKTFNDSFTAVAKPGYVFSKWAAGDGFLCGNSANATCVANNTATPSGNADIDNYIAGGSLFYAMPLFTFVGIDTDGDGTQDHLDADDDNDGIFDTEDLCPLNADPNCNSYTDTITANGKEWLQVSLFTNLSWNDINAVCPVGNAGVCSGTLKGYDMNGWTWANGDDIAALFNGYGVLPPLTTPNFVGSRNAPDSAWAPAFFGAGWRPTTNDFNIPYFRRLFAFTFYTGEVEGYFPPGIVEFDDSPPGAQDGLAIGWGAEGIGPQNAISFFGAFFYR